METKICERCRLPFPKKPSQSKTVWAKARFCSQVCRKEPSRECAFPSCDVRVERKGRTRWHGVEDVYCSQTHAKKGKIPPNMEGNHAKRAVEGDPNKVCEICSAEFVVRGKRKLWGKYCSNKCAGKAISLNQAAENHWNWQGGITEESRKGRMTPEYNEWRFAVYARDHYTCQECRIKCTKKTIIAHHILEWATHPELRFDVDNGVVMCRSCHLRHHNKARKEARLVGEEQDHPKEENNEIANLQLRQGSHGSGHCLACGDCGSINVVPMDI